MNGTLWDMEQKIETFIVSISCTFKSFSSFILYEQEIVTIVCLKTFFIPDETHD
jgi:hypothetical protein